MDFRFGLPVAEKKRFLWLAPLVGGLLAGMALVVALAANGCGGKGHDNRIADETALLPINARLGLPNLRTKLEAGEPVNVAFLGGSITQNGGEGGFVSALPDWIGGRYPKSKIVANNAGISATGSDWGEKRIDRDVLDKNPDLLIVEFAVNDGDRDSAADMERIVRKTRLANPETEILFLYTTSDVALRQMGKGHVPEAIKNHETIAAHYGIPSIALGSDLRSLLRSGTSKWEDLFHDACHPTAEGYASYNRDIVSGFKKILAVGSPGAKALPDSFALEGGLYAPDLTAMKPPAPAPMRNDDGFNAGRVWEMPALGSEWIREPRFQQAFSDWDIRYRVFPSGLPQQVEMKRENQEAPLARWFEEAAGFTGSNSRVMASSTPGGGSTLSVVSRGVGGGVEVPEVLWQPHQSGRYRVVFHVERITGHAYTSPAWGGVEIAVSGADEQTTETLKIPFVERGEPPNSTPHEIVQTLQLEPGARSASVWLEKGWNTSPSRGSGFPLDGSGRQLAVIR